MNANIIRIPVKSVYVASNQPNQNFDGCSSVLFGKNSSATLFKGLFQFDICELPKGYVITSANLAMYITTNENPSVSKLYYIFRVREEFDEATVTYNTVPDLDTSADCTAFSIGNEIYTYTRVDITRLVNQWYTGRYDNYGLLITPVNEAIVSAISAYSKNIADERYYPMLEITMKMPVLIAYRETLSATETIAPTYNDYRAATVYDVSQDINYTYFVKNTGAQNCDVRLEISADGSNWIVDSQVYTVTPNQTVSIIPKAYSKYARISYKSSVFDLCTSINITIQTQK